MRKYCARPGHEPTFDEHDLKRYGLLFVQIKKAVSTNFRATAILASYRSLRGNLTDVVKGR